MKNNIYITLGLALLSLWGHSQKRDIKKANKDYTTYAYAEAIDSYEALIAAGHSESSVYRNLANANYFNANYGEAANWYAKLFENLRKTCLRNSCTATPRASGQKRPMTRPKHGWKNFQMPRHRIPVPSSGKKIKPTGRPLLRTRRIYDTKLGL